MAKTGKPTRPMLGAHMSIAGEVGESLNRGKQVGCDCIQIFTKSSRQWASKPLSEEEIEKFKHNQIETGITTVIAHDSYLVNLGAPDHAMRTKSVKGFIDELHRCEVLGVPILVAHPGSHVGSGVENGIKTIAKSIDEAHAACKGFKVKIALEITAGQGSNLGHTFEQMAQIFDAVVENERLRLCFDTEHAFAAGYDIRTPEAAGSVSSERFDQRVPFARRSPSAYRQRLHRAWRVSAAAQRSAIFRTADVPRDAQGPRDERGCRELGDITQSLQELTNELTIHR
jgi:deoxyribonuclease-4